MANTKKPQPAAWYQQIVDEHTPRKRLFRNCLAAFGGGGLLCALAEAGRVLLVRGGHTDDTASAWVLVAVIFLTALFTGLGLYDKLAQKLGAGLAVPISGFANSVAAAMLEHRYEGLVMGSGCNSFKLAGAVVVFGTMSAAVIALIMLACGWL